MDKLDPNLKAQLAKSPNGSFPVIITCKMDCRDLLTQLKKTNTPVGDQLLDLNMLTGILPGKDIEALAARDDVEQIAFDEEASTL